MTPRMPAARNALRVLALLGAQVGPVSAATIARELGMPRSSTYQLLQVMRDEGFLVHDPAAAVWGPSALVHAVGARTLAATRLERIGQPLLDRLAADSPIPVTAHLAVLAGADVAYAGRAATRRSPVTVSRVGVRLPTVVTATGRALLAAHNDAQIVAQLPHLSEVGGNAPRTRAELNSVLAQVRRRGWAVERGEVDAHYGSVAAVARDATGFPAAAVGITFRIDDADRLDSGATEADRTGDHLPTWPGLGATVIATAEALTRRLAGRSTTVTTPASTQTRLRIHGASSQHRDQGQRGG